MNRPGAPGQQSAEALERGVGSGRRPRRDGDNGVSSTVTNAIAPSRDASGQFIDQLKQLWKHRWIVISIMAVTLCVDALWVLRQPKVYAAVATVQFDPSPPRPLGRQVEEVDTGGVGSYWSLRDYYETQYRVARSRGVAEGVVRRLGLQHDPDFLRVPRERRRSFRSVSVSDAAQALTARVKVDPVRDSRLMNITVEDYSPRRAQLLANTLADVYVQRNLDHRMSATRDAVRWLSTQLDDLRVKLTRSEDALEAFRREHNIVSNQFVDQRNIVGSRITRLSEALTEAQTRRFNLAARTAELQRAAREITHALRDVGTPSLDASPDARQDWKSRVTAAMGSLTAPELLSSTVLASLRTQFELAAREEAALEPRYLPRAAELRTARARTNSVVSMFAAEVDNIRGANEAELRAITRTESNLRTELAAAHRQAVELNQQEMVYSRLSRERDNHSKIYGIVLERTTEGGLMGDLQVNNMNVLDYALLPLAPIKPKVVISLALGGIAGLALGLLASLLAIQADRTVRSRVDVEDRLATACLGVVPSATPRASRKGLYRYQYGHTPNNEAPVENLDLVVHSHPTSSIAELMRGVRTNLLFMSPDRPIQHLMVASAMPREGKTFTAVSLAITLAQSSKRVLIVDADMRRPRIHKVFKIRPPVGLTSVLIGEATLEEAICETSVPNLFVLPCGPIPPNPAELIASQRTIELIAQLRERFDRIVWDTPPVTAVADAIALGPQLDGVVMVLKARSTRLDDAESSLRQMNAVGAHIIGCVLNAVDPRDDTSSYFYGKRYAAQPQPDADADANADT